ncbi:hypothetical protein [Acidocella sp.]|uniref:hypothetical protein n=1 Tax=Acidocella sp. TaxID=50710 RepID=UPI002622BA38|nr:hypothetical protein [Acidocella sp.]
MTEEVKMRALIIAALALFPFVAHAAPANYAIECTAPCVASDGTTQPAGTFLNTVVADPSNGWLPTDGAGNSQDVKLVPDTRQPVYVPKQASP